MDVIDRLARAGGRLNFRIHLGIGLAAAVVLVAGLWTMHDLGGRLERAMADIALSGRQEMLAQRIALDAGRLVDAPAPGIETRLAQAIDGFDRGYRLLSAEADATPRLTLAFFESGTLALQALSRHYLELARSVLDDPAAVPRPVLVQIARIAATALSAQQGEATDAFAEHAGTLAARLEILQSAVLAALAALLAAEAGLVAWPLRRALAGAVARERRDETEIGQLGSTLGKVRAETTRLTDRLIEVGWTDELTGLMNRGHFQIWLESELARRDAPAAPLGVMAISLDNFRALNEAHGHAAGDALLQSTAARIAEAGPRDAAVARTDGNGFALAARFADRAALLATAERLRRALAGRVLVSTREVRLSASFGLALHAPPEPADRLLGNAEIALGRLHDEEPGRMLVFAPAMRAELEDRETLATELRVAIEERALEAHFQPQVALGGAGLLGFEVLARWPHSQHGLLAPDRFLDAAAHGGLTGALDRLVLEQGLASLARLRDEGHAIPRLSVNASAQSLLAPDYAGALRDMMTAAGLAPADLAVEIAGPRLREIDESEAQEAMNQLRWAGFAVEIDGFGTGMATLSTLSRLPVTGVKLDRALVATLPDTGAESVLRALAALARDLGLTVIAEGVQSSTSLGFLAGIGVQAVQGFGIARPLSEDGVRAWMGANATTAA